MNQRIRKLAKQTGYIWHASGDPQIYEFTPEKLEKFAESIVKECGVALSPMLRDMVSRGQAYDLIKEHFGVEE